MRLIKFRVWGLYGDEYTYTDKENQAEAESFWDKRCIAILDEKHIVDCGTDEDGDGDGYEYCDVEEVETIEQYTGLKDKNGKEIYEGDIVVNTYYDDGEMYKVLWVEDSVAFGMESLDDMELYKLPLESLEVIGNIHENPELLEGEE